MIVGFSRHGTGGGRGPTEYMTDQDREGRESQPPEVLRGDAEQTKNLIDSLDFKHKYSSGVLSFAPGETISSEIENKIMDRFEEVAFAGLNQDQYNILWVRHTHAGHHELHFVTPRVELLTGKSMNIRPPGEKTKQHFDDFRSEINAKYGLADPTDPSRAKQVSTPDHELKIASEALRSGQKPSDNMRELLDEVLTKRAVEGLINSREELLENVKELGFDVPRAGKNYITVADSDTGQRWRLKGGLYERDFEPSRTIEKAERARVRDFSKADEHAASRYAERVEQHIAARAGYNQSRFGGIEQNLNLAYFQKQDILANVNGPEPLSGFISRGLGDRAICEQTASNSHRAKEKLEADRGQDVRSSIAAGSEWPVHCSAPRIQGRGQLETGQTASIEAGQGIEHDRIRTPLIERIRKIGSQLQSAVGAAKQGAERITEHVRDYFERKSGIESAGRELDRSSQQLNQAFEAQKSLEREHVKERDFSLSF